MVFSLELEKSGTALPWFLSPKAVEYFRGRSPAVWACVSRRRVLDGSLRTNAPVESQAVFY